MRKTKVVTITDEGRDKGKQFLLTEMPASRAEKWAVRALLALARSGVDVPDNLVLTGMAGLMEVGLLALRGISFSDAEPLLDEMIGCVMVMPDPIGNPTFARNLIEDDIEEVATRVQLRSEVFSLHTDFFSLADKLKSTSGTAPT